MIYNLFNSDLGVLSIFLDNYRVQRDTRFERFIFLSTQSSVKMN